MNEVVEFEADIEDFTIKVPRKYKDLDSKHVKISIVEARPTEIIYIPKGFNNPLEVSSYSLISKRDDIYER